MVIKKKTLRFVIDEACDQKARLPFRLQTVKHPYVVGLPVPSARLFMQLYMSQIAIATSTISPFTFS